MCKPHKDERVKQRASVLRVLRELRKEEEEEEQLNKDDLIVS